MLAAWQRIRITATGFDTPLSIESVATPMVPTGDEVRVRVEACGVCHRDLLDRGGRFPFIQLPVTPGHEACGVVEAAGPDVKQWRVGDRVATMHRNSCGSCGACSRGEVSLCESAAAVPGILADGGYATFLCLPERAFYPVPADLPAAHAAILHCTFGTAYRDLITLGNLQRGERVLITGGNGGVGSAAVQIAKRVGADVIAVVRDERHRAFVERLGAEVVVDSGRKFHDSPQVDRVDLVLDTVGTPTFPAALRSLRVGGRIVTVGNVTADRVQLNLGFLITYGLTIIGGSGANPAEMEKVIAMHQAEPFAFTIDRELPLADAEQAQMLVRDGGLQGRIVLRP